jgi:hypothetical protein
MRVVPDPTRPGGAGDRFSGRARRRWSAAVLVVAAVAILVRVPGVPGHHQAYLLGDLAASDAGVALSRSVPFRADEPTRPCEMLESKFEMNNHLLRDHNVGWYGSIWSSYQTLNALYVTSLLPHETECRSDLEDNVGAINAFYWDTSYHGSPAAFDQGPAAIHFHPDPPRVDDSLWMGLALDREYVITRNRAYLGRAEAVFRMAVANWDPRGGGIYWKNHTDGGTGYEKAVVSNAPAVVLGAALYRETGRSSYLTWSARMVSWLQSHLLDPGAGLYNDHVGDDSGPTTLDRDKLTYTQGIMVGALAALAVVDPARYPLSDAVHLADRSMGYFSTHHSYGNPAWDAIWSQYLLWSAGLYRNQAFTQAARASVELALRSDPTGSRDLLFRGAETELRTLSRLPSAEYPQLSDVRGGTR